MELKELLTQLPPSFAYKMAHTAKLRMEVMGTRWLAGYYSTYEDNYIVEGGFQETLTEAVAALISEAKQHGLKLPYTGGAKLKV